MFEHGVEYTVDRRIDRESPERSGRGTEAVMNPFASPSSKRRG